MGSVKTEPKITVGIMDRQTEVNGRLDGGFRGDTFGCVSGRFSAKAEAEAIVLFDEAHHEIARSPLITLIAQEGSTFSLFNVTIGNRFHWERREDQTFQGDLILRPRKDGTIAAINEIPLERYLEGVISSEMSGAAPMEFLKAHAILSRSWLLAALDRLPDEPLAGLGESDYRGRRTPSFFIGNDLGFATFHDGYAGVGGTEVNSDNLTHKPLTS